MNMILNNIQLRNDFLKFVVADLVTKRKRLEYTQEELNARLGVADRLVGKWEVGIRTPTSFHLYCWADALDMRLCVFDKNFFPLEPVNPAIAIPATNDNRFMAIH